jgi:hypothetical protein
MTDKKKKKVDKNSIHYKGGIALKKKYGNDHFRNMVNKRWNKEKGLTEE